jgi:hypothetical protein
MVWDYDSSYEDLLQKSKLPSLKIRRIRTIAIETFKIIHRKSPQYLLLNYLIISRYNNFFTLYTGQVFMKQKIKDMGLVHTISTHLL